MKSFLQTNKWLQFQRNIGRKCWRYEKDGITANIIRHDLPFRFNYLYIPYGPEIYFSVMPNGIKNAVGGFMTYVRQLAWQEKSLHVKFEPIQDNVVETLYPYGLVLSRKHIQPGKTLVLDLTKSEQELLSGMHHKTRYNINLATRKGMTIEKSDDVETFVKLLKKTAEHDKFYGHEAKYYENLLKEFSDAEMFAKLYLIKHEGKYIAGAICLIGGDYAYYLHGAMDRNYRALMAPHYMHWELIKQFKAAGIKLYDFWGIDSSRWPGVTRFKLGFGGRVIEYPGSFDLVRRRFWYWVYNLKQKI